LAKGIQEILYSGFLRRVPTVLDPAVDERSRFWASPACFPLLQFDRFQPRMVLIDEVLLNWIPSTAYGVMESHQRRYFRCAVTLPVSVRTTAGDHLKCMSINVSSNGLALNTPTPLELGAAIDLVVELTAETAIAGKGAVIWDDKHGKAGIHFRCNSHEMQSQLDSWLARQSAQSGI